MNKAELLSLIGARRIALTSLWANAGEAQLTDPARITPLWSVKDLIAHLTYWERYVLDDLRVAVAGGTPAPLGDTEIANTRCYLENKDRALADVFADFDHSHRDMLAFIDTTTDDVLNADAAWAEGGSMAAHIAYEYVDHYDDHLPDLRAWRDPTSVTNQ